MCYLLQTGETPQCLELVHFLHSMASRCSLAKTHRMEIRKALAVIRRSKTSRKQVSVKWVVGRDSNFSGLVFGLLTFSGESAAEYEANSGLL